MIKLQESRVDVLHVRPGRLRIGQDGLNGVQLSLILRKTGRNRLNRKRLDHLGSGRRGLRDQRGKSGKPSCLHRPEVNRDAVDGGVETTKGDTIRCGLDLSNLFTATKTAQLLLDLVDGVTDTTQGDLVGCTLNVGDTLGVKPKLLLDLVDGTRDPGELRLVRRVLNVLKTLGSFGETELGIDLVDRVRQCLEVDLTCSLREIPKTVGRADLADSGV